MTLMRPEAKVRALSRERTLTKHIIDASRAGEVVDEFLRQWKFELTDDIEGAILDFRLNRWVDALCRRLADNPDVEINKEPRGARAPGGPPAPVSRQLG